MGNKTVKRLAILIGVIALLGGGGYILWAFQVERMAHGVVARAEGYEKQGKYEQAERLYREHLAVVPGDIDVQLKYAEALLKGEKTLKRQQEALAIYEEVLRKYPGRDDVRRRAADLAFEVKSLDRARAHLEILLKTARDDGGHLEYLRARCEEEADEFDKAENDYGSAIAHEAPERLEAAQRRAMLLREKLNKKDEADRVIQAMVESAPDHYQAYLGRGRYRESSFGQGGGDASRLALQAAGGAALGTFVSSGIGDFFRALGLAPDRPEVYLELARAVERVPGPDVDRRLDAARQILDKGLAAAPKSVEMYVALSNLEQRAGRGEQAVQALELGLKALPEELSLRWMEATLLAGRGEAESGRLLLRIAELERLGASRVFTQYLTAYYHLNKREFTKARRILTQLQTDLVRGPEAIRSAAKLLLDRCQAERGEPDQQQAAGANPNDLAARLALIQAMIGRNDLEGAIREYRGVYARQPGVALLPLASLLIDRNRRLKGQQDWSEVERLIGEAMKAAPAAIEPKLLRVRMLLAQGEEGPADDALKTIRGQFPEDPRPWTIPADALIERGKFDDARALLDRARKGIGDRVELRLARMKLAAARGGPRAVPALKEQGQGLESFSREDRRRLLTALALELEKQEDPGAASDAWAQLARDDPESLQPRLRLLDLALKTGDAKQAEGQIREVEKLDDQFGYLCRAQYLAWQARRATEPAAKEKAWAEARGLLTELGTRRPDWSRVPLALARLDEAEFAEAGTDEVQKREKAGAAGADEARRLELEKLADEARKRKDEKRESAITSYRRAIDLGLRDPAVVGRYIQLLIGAGRKREAMDFYNQMPAIGQNGGDLGRMVTQVALANRDYQQVEDIAKRAVDANPDDFQARVWLSQVLMEQRKYKEGEDEIRKGIAADKADPDRWIALVRLLVLARQFGRAEQAVRDAEAPLAATPLALAQCCEIMGKALELSEPDRAKSWYGQARGWFDKAQQALKDPGDLTVKRQLAGFLLETDAAAEAEGLFRDILARTADGKSPVLATWARRGLAQAYVNANPPRTAEALALFSAKPGQDGDPDDLRVLSLIHQAQGTPEGRRQAIGDLEPLIRRGAATPEDRLRLAQLLEAAGDWPRAREQFGELIRGTDAARDLGTLTRRPLYLELFVMGLLRHHKPGDDSDLDEARGLVEKLKTTPASPLAAVLLEAQIDKSAGRIEAATKRIREFAARPDVTTAGRLRLASAAENLGLFDAAETVFRRAADEPPPDRNSLPNAAGLALFFAHRGKLEEAINLCEGLWANPALREATANLCVAILCDPAAPVDDTQTRRVVGWFERASAENPQSMVYLVGLGNLFERLGDYPGAEDSYRKAIKINDRDGIASNNLAWLMALRDGQGKEALDLINNAIRAKGVVPEYLDTRGMIYLATGQGQRAIADLEAAFKAAPTAPKYFHLAQAYLMLKDKDKARKALEAGKTRGLPGGLHRLEVPQYNKVASELGLR